MIMKKSKNLFISIISIVIITTGISLAISNNDKDNEENQINTRVDNNHYWQLKAKKGLVLLNPETKVVFQSSL